MVLSELDIPPLRRSGQTVFLGLWIRIRERRNLWLSGGSAVSVATRTVMNQRPVAFRPILTDSLAFSELNN